MLFCCGELWIYILIITSTCNLAFLSPGIVPITCERLFQGIDEKKEEKSSKEYQVFTCKHAYCLSLIS